MLNKMIVYALCDARTHRVRYIGSSEIGIARPARITGYRDNTALYAWLRDLTVCGSEHVILVLAEAPDIATLRALERSWIEHGRRSGWPLLNRAGFTLDIEAADSEPKDPPTEYYLESDKRLPVGQRRERRRMRAWRRDPEVRARLQAARDSRTKKKKP